MAKLKCLFIGDELDSFQAGGLHEEINKRVCTGCRKTGASCSNEDGKPECEGLALMGIVENQVGHAGILFMKELVKVWGEVKDNTIFCPVCNSPSMALVVYWPGQKPLGHGNYWYCYECQRCFPEAECTKG